MTLDNLIPLSIACFNKESNLRRECIAGIPEMCARVGAQTLSDFFLVPCLVLLNDKDEEVVVQTIKSLEDLLHMQIIQKEEALNIFNKILPFLLHPNAWIREETIKYIVFLADPKNNFLSKAEAFCKMRPKIKQFIKPGHLIFDLSKSDLVQEKILDPIPKSTYNRILSTAPLSVKKEVSRDTYENVDSPQLIEVMNSLSPEEQIRVNLMKSELILTQQVLKQGDSK